MTAVTTPAAPPFPALPVAPSGAELDSDAFRCIAGLARREAGLAIPSGKAAMVRTRLARRLRALDLPGFDAYCALIQSPDGRDELAAMISALTTNVSQFFREKHHFDILREQVLPGLVKRARRGGRVRIWSSGCSNGQEPYSIAICLCEAGLTAAHDVRVLATDIDPRVVAHARAGRYPAHMMTGLPDGLRDRYFRPAPARGEHAWQVRSRLSELVTFQILNLIDLWPMHGQFDVVFCRNVAIYFDPQTTDRLWPRLARRLLPGGWLFVGHSESIPAATERKLISRGMTSYQLAGPADASPRGVSATAGPGAKRRG